MALAHSFVDRGPERQPRNAEIRAELAFRGDRLAHADPLDQLEDAISRLTLFRGAGQGVHVVNRNGTGDLGKWSIPLVASWLQTRYGGLDMGRGSEPITEFHRADRADLDLRSTLELVELINAEDATVAGAVHGIAGELAAAIDAVSERLPRRGRRGRRRRAPPA